MDKLRLHPSEKDLLLFADGELGKRAAAQVERHLASCWDCRARLAQTESTITEFVTLRRKLLDHRIEGTDFQSGRSARALFAARMEEAIRTSRVPFGQVVRRALWPVVNRPMWVAGTLAVILAFLLVFEPLMAPSVSAMDVIANGTAAEQRRVPGAVMHQRVRVRCKSGRASTFAAVDYDVWRSGARTRTIAASGHPGPAERLRALYRDHGADWDNPLSASSFARLRDSIGAVRDKVRGRDEITVTSVPAEREGYSGEVQRVELTVRKSDWHAIAQRIQLRDADYELTELLDEAVARDKVDPSIFGQPPAPVMAALLPPPRPAAPAPAALPPGPTPEQLDEAELSLREAFHQTWADVEEVPEIRREGAQIRFRLFTQSAKRKEEILTALAGIPFLAPEITDAETLGSSAAPAPGTVPTPPAAAPQSGAPAAPSAEAAPPAGVTLYSTRPPLAKALREYSGGLDPANNYLNAVRDSYLQVLLDASALGRLTERYPESEWNQLPAESRQRLNRIARDHVDEVRTSLESYLELVSPVLDEMAAKQGIALPGTSEPNDRGCTSWRTGAKPLVTDLGSLQTSFRRLFVEDRIEAPVVLSATDLLRESLEARARLRLYQLCQP